MEKTTDKTTPGYLSLVAFISPDYKEESTLNQLTQQGDGMIFSNYIPGAYSIRNRYWLLANQL